MDRASSPTAWSSAYAAADAHPEDWDLVGLNEALHRQFDFAARPADSWRTSASQRRRWSSWCGEAVGAHYREREREMGAELFHRLERWIVLGLEWEGGGFRGINQLWREHLLNMDHLKEGIGLRGYGQRDPLTEYKKEAFDMFQEMIEQPEGGGGRAALQGAHRRGRSAEPRRVARRRRPSGSETRGGESRGEPARPRGPPRAAASLARRTARRSAATICARAARARSTRSAAC